MRLFLLEDDQIENKRGPLEYRESSVILGFAILKKHMKLILLILGLCFQLHSFSQDSEVAVQMSPGFQKRVKQEIEKEVSVLKEGLEKAGENDVHIAFTLDTFRVERLMDKTIDSVYNDFVMRDIVYMTAALYDSLLNKYYKKLLSALKGDDKKMLLQAQKAWLSFRDNETKLVQTISKDDYSGGGTAQELTESSAYLNLVKERTIDLFEHYVRATRSE
jgi:uncharacterized protein YecT (DUF1311 family)